MRTDPLSYQHIHITNGGTITVAYDLTEEKQVRYGVAFCSPSDQFSRKRGCTIARGRHAKRFRVIPQVTEDLVSDILADIDEGNTPLRPYRQGARPGPKWFFGE